MSAIPSGKTCPSVLLVHNRYQQAGGEDAVVENEAALLQARGHRVLRHERHNEELRQLPRWQGAAQAFWSAPTTHALDVLIEAQRPDLLHVHNTWPLVSPAVFWAGRRHGLPVVLTLHNARLLCPQALMLREGRPCTDCVGRLPWRGVLHRCYRDSAMETALVAGVTQLHRLLGTWSARVDRYIALSEFARQLFIRGGLPAGRIVVKPHFAEVPQRAEQPRQGLLFVGRLAEEKGLHLLALAAETLPPGECITVIGDGPLRATLQSHPRLRLLGAQPAPAVLEQMRRAQALVLPSLVFEMFPRTLVEAAACGLPVLAADHGPMPELVQHERTGLLFEPGDAASLGKALRRVLESPQDARRWGEAAREHQRAHWSAETNYLQLSRIYADLLC
ncbi:glycosyltransferase [Mitsuaria sp. WAJ17]|uniref:glycosyltransferase n=1 Tax=Mitsuaria sp. WAJ17 TaxID=2761452 RepID=UPI001600B36B|nr:glycosyltransferase [Mitsuaria sp. WAJ17]MBB2484311.1 glycosyltransferase [Mitsuaria sp. WAJ17]